MRLTTLLEDNGRLQQRKHWQQKKACVVDTFRERSRLVLPVKFFNVILTNLKY